MAMKYSYRTMGTCSSQIDFEVEDGVLKDVRFMGGCNGNLKGISALVEDMKVDEVIARLEGIRCGWQASYVVVVNRPLVLTSSARLCGKSK